MSAARACRLAAAKADVAIFFSTTLLATLVGRGAIKRADVALIMASLREALPAGDATIQAELAALDVRARQVFDRAEELHRQNVERIVQREIGS